MAGPWKDQWPLTASPSLYLDGQNKYNRSHHQIVIRRQGQNNHSDTETRGLSKWPLLVNCVSNIESSRLAFDVPTISDDPAIRGGQVITLVPKTPPAFQGWWVSCQGDD